VFIEYISETLDGPVTMVSPDTGRVKLASRYARRLDAEVAFVHKRRSVDEANKVAALQVVGEIKDRHVIMVDDMIDTAGTVAAAAELLQAGGALSVRAMATHGIFSAPAVDRLKNAPIDEVVVTNTLPTPEDAAELPNLTVLSIARDLARTLKAIFKDASVSSLFMGENV
jgi:ribose-phosphate pyrophosphokinase